MAYFRAEPARFGGRNSAIRLMEQAGPGQLRGTCLRRQYPVLLSEYVTIQRHTAQHPSSCSDESLHERGR